MGEDTDPLDSVVKLTGMWSWSVATFPQDHWLVKQSLSLYGRDTSMDILGKQREGGMSAK